jgi:hypothetical protein
MRTHAGSDHRYSRNTTPSAKRPTAGGANRAVGTVPRARVCPAPAEEPITQRGPCREPEHGLQPPLGVADRDVGADDGRLLVVRRAGRPAGPR